MKTVCFFIADISRTGGTERLSSALAEKFSEKYKVIILSLSGNNIPAFPAKNVKYYSLFKKKHRFKLLIPVVLARLFSFLKKNLISRFINSNKYLFNYYKCNWKQWPYGNGRWNYSKRFINKRWWKL